MNGEKSRLQRQFEFCLEADKEKRIMRRTLLSNGKECENDAEHAWHAALMAILLGEYANEEIDLLKTVTMHTIIHITDNDILIIIRSVRDLQPCSVREHTDGK